LVLILNKNDMETDDFVVKTEAEIAKLMNLRRQHRKEIRDITAIINKLEFNVRLRKVGIIEAQKNKRLANL